jgi:hypothetical protein
MDQVKEYLNLAAKHRFWIAIGVAALLPLIGYFVGAGSIQAQEEESRKKVEDNYKAVQVYEGKSTPVNKDYKPLVDKEKDALQKDVNAAWRKLYARQAPLLTWPEEVAGTFSEWGRKWPEDVDRNVVYQAVDAYIRTYDPYVQQVYQTLRPFDFETGKGIVVAPPAEVLLRPTRFDEVQLPTLGQVWAAQEKLWIQRTVLDVLAQVNAKAGAKDWPTAPVKQLNSLDVAGPEALDQVSVSEGTALVEPEELDPVAKEAAEASESGTSTGGAADQATMMRSRMGGMGMGMPGMGGAVNTGPPRVMYLDTPSKDQVYIVPISLSVYVEQEAIPNLIVEFQNSPMNIQITEVEVVKPAPHTVQKPVKGDKSMLASMGGGIGMGSGGMMGMGRGGMLGDMMMGGYGGGMDVQSMMRGAMGRGTSGGYGNMGDMQSMMRGAMGRGTSGGYGNMGGAYGGRFGGPGAATTKKETGKDISKETLERRKEAAKEKAKGQDGSESEGEEKAAPAKKTGADPYYDIVEVRLFGRARFYHEPPKEEPTTEAASAETPDAAAPDAGATAETPTPAGVAPEAAPAEAETPPAESPKPEGETPAGEASTPAPPENQPALDPGAGETPKG